MLANPQRTR